MSRETRCPNCGAPTVLGPANPWRPFCCERCKLIDFGDWLSGRHRIAGTEPAGTDDPPPPPPPH